MKVTLPDTVPGTRDHIFILKVEFPVSTAERKVRVDTEGPIEALDVDGNGPGGDYTVHVGLESLHVPLRVKDGGEAPAKVAVRCTGGPEEGEAFSQTLELAAPAKAPWLCTASVIRLWVLTSSSSRRLAET